MFVERKKERGVCISVQYAYRDYFKTCISSVRLDRATRCPEISGLDRKHYMKPGIIFQSPDFLKHKSNFLIVMGICTNFDNYMHPKSTNFVKNCLMMPSIKI